MADVLKSKADGRPKCHVPPPLPARAPVKSSPPCGGDLHKNTTKLTTHSEGVPELPPRKFNQLDKQSFDKPKQIKNKYQNVEPSGIGITTSNQEAICAKADLVASLLKKFEGADEKKPILAVKPQILQKAESSPKVKHKIPIFPGLIVEPVAGPEVPHEPVSETAVTKSRSSKEDNAVHFSSSSSPASTIPCMNGSPKRNKKGPVALPRPQGRKAGKLSTDSENESEKPMLRLHIPTNNTGQGSGVKPLSTYTLNTPVDLPAPRPCGSPVPPFSDLHRSPVTNRPARRDENQEDVQDVPKAYHTTIIDKIDKRESIPFMPPPPPPNAANHTVPTQEQYMQSTTYVRQKRPPSCPDESLPLLKQMSPKLDAINKELAQAALELLQIHKKLDELDKESSVQMDRYQYLRSRRQYRRLLGRDLVLDEKRKELTTQFIDELMAQINKVFFDIDVCLGLPIHKVKDAGSFELWRSEYLASELFSQYLTKMTVLLELQHEQSVKWFDINEHINNVLNDCRPCGENHTEKVKSFLESVIDELGVIRPEFSCDLIGVGSHHDGTKTHHFDEIDFVLKLRYTPGDCYELERTKNPLEYSIKPKVNETDLLKYCDEHGRLLASKFKSAFRETICAILSQRSDDRDVQFGGFDTPEFGGIQCNGPALTVIICDISVDLTLAFAAPEAILFQTMKNTSPVLIGLLKKHLNKYLSYGLFVPYAETEWKISTSWLETRLLKSLDEKHIIKSALKVCKHYNKTFFQVKWPCLKMFFRHQINNLSEELSRTIQPEYTKLLKRYNPKDNVGIEMMIYVALRDCKRVDNRKPRDEDGQNVLASMSSLKAVCKNRLMKFLSDSDKTSLHPSLAHMVGEQVAPLIGSPSVIFKYLIFAVFINNQSMSTDTVNPSFIINVLKQYEKKEMYVPHPFLDEMIQVRKIKCHTDHLYMPLPEIALIYNSHFLHVSNIVTTLQKCFDES